MPIDRKMIVSANVVVVAATEPVGLVFEKLPLDRNQRAFGYVVIVETATSPVYRVVQWLQIERIGRTSPGDLFDVPIGALPGLPSPVPAVDINSNQREALELRDQQRPLRVVVVVEKQTVLGLLVSARRSDAEIGDDPFLSRAEASMPAYDTEVVLGGKTVEPPDVLVPEPPATPQTDDRVINAWIEDDQVKTGQPLQLGETYELKFNVESPRTGVIGVATIDVPRLFENLPATTEKVEVVVVLDSDNFEIIGGDQGVIVVPRIGRSRNSATFSVAPKKNGIGVVRALFFANNRMFQKMKLTIQVGAVAPESAVLAKEISGRSFASAFASMPRPQEIDLVILKKDVGYEFILNSGGFRRALVNLSEQQIADITATARDDLKKIVYAKDGNRYVYQSLDTQVPEAVHQQTLQTLMGTGVDLFETLFFAPGSGADANELGRVLREKSRASQLNISIIAERFTFPWALLYDRDYDADNVDPEGFWGFKHIIEFAPEFRNATTTNLSPEIFVESQLNLGFVVNTTIDDELRRKGVQTEVVQPQQAFLRTLPGVAVTEYPNKSDLVQLLRDANGSTQLMYFYCHAESALPGAPGGVDASRVILSDGPITLRDLKRAAPLSKTQENLQSSPLVFLNACESAELSPYIYDGLVPYLIAKGARGVLGTEVNTPALFAAEFAQLFLQRFVAGGEPLGALLLALRREYLYNKNNVMGLVYALHSGADVVVRRAAG